MKQTLLVIALAIAGLGWAQEGTKTEPDDSGVSIVQESGLVTIASKGSDVRNVLFDLFSQSKKSFVLEPNIHFVLYLALTGVQFDEALEIVCHTASLKYEVSNDIYYISQGKQSEVKVPAKPKPEISPKPLGKLTDKDLFEKKVTTRLPKADLRDVFSEFTKQTGIMIEVDKSVPAYKVDAYLVNTSLKYAIEVITRSAGLVCVRTDNKTLRIENKPKT